MNIFHLSDNEFEKEVLQTEKLLLVDFWAPWCAPCKIVAPILEELSKEYNEKLKICKINLDENKTVAAKYQILSIPTLLFFKGGKVLRQLAGARSLTDIKKTIDSLL